MDLELYFGPPPTRNGSECRGDEAAGWGSSVCGRRRLADTVSGTFHASGFGVCGNSRNVGAGSGGGAADGEEEDRFLGKCNQRPGGGGRRGSTLDGEGRGGSPSLKTLPGYLTDIKI